MESAWCKVKVEMPSKDGWSGVENRMEFLGAVVKIKIVDLAWTQLSTGQINHLWQKIVEEEKMILEDLNMSGVNLCRADGEMMARAFVKMKKVYLGSTQLLPAQINILCDTIVDQEKMDLEVIHLRDVYLRKVDADKLARAVVRVKTVYLQDTFLTGGQLSAICRRITGEKQLALKTLVLDGKNKLKGVRKALREEAMNVVEFSVRINNEGLKLNPPEYDD
jgi:hypothetical protein